MVVGYANYITISHRTAHLGREFEHSPLVLAAAAAAAATCLFMLPVARLVRTQLKRNCVAATVAAALIWINKHDTTQSAVSNNTTGGARQRNRRSGARQQLVAC